MTAPTAAQHEALKLQALRALDAAEAIREAFASNFTDLAKERLRRAASNIERAAQQEPTS